MDDKIVMYNLGPSPNNMKVRIALNYKGLPFDTVPVDGMDKERAQVVAVSGQPLTPVIKHGDTVVYDSRAILRYLDSNFRDTPPLLSSDYDTQQEIERLEEYARYEIGRLVLTVFMQAFEESPDLAACKRASELVNERTGVFESRLQNQPFLVGDRLTLADVSAAPYVFLATLPPEAGDNPIAEFFSRNFRLGEGRDKTREWVMRVMAYDRQEQAVEA